MGPVEELYEKSKRKARRFLIMGTIFLAGCLGFVQVVAWLDWPAFLSESAIIAGWVAFGKPIEMYLYELPDLRRERDKERKLAKE